MGSVTSGDNFKTIVATITLKCVITYT